MKHSKQRTRAILKVLGVSLVANVILGSLKIYYGRSANSLAFVADGVHTYFDAAATLLGMVSISLSAAPPDEGHPYGHYKYETLSSVMLSLILCFAAYEVGSSAFARLSESGPASVPTSDFRGVFLVILALTFSFSIGKWEGRMAAVLKSSFLKADALHNTSDLLTSLGVLTSVASAHFRIPRVDAWVSLGIAAYLIYLSLRLMVENAKPLLDASVIDPRRVQAIAESTEGVLHCHHVRSRGEKGHYFLDLNLHLPGSMTLYQAHELSHEVEAKLKHEFPGLVDVVIHTEPDDHPPCSS